MKITLIQLPTVGLQLKGYTPEPICLGNIYNKIMPISLPRVASVLQRNIGADASIEDLRIAEPLRKETYNTINWEGFQLEAQRIGAPFSSIDSIIKNSDWLGMSCHFAFESEVAKDLIQYAKKVNPKVKIMVGGADAKSNPQRYIGFGADLVFQGDANPDEITKNCLEGRIVGPYRHPFNELTTPDFSLLPNLELYVDGHDGPVPVGVKGPVGFIYFTRGCTRDCSFCESRQSKYETLSLEDSVRMLEHYKAAGIRTLNVVDDNLLLQTANSQSRKKVIAIFERMRELDFAWEFPNGLEVGMLARKGTVDAELIDSLFSRGQDSHGNIVGAYRLYFPIETFERRDDYRKLKGLDIQNLIIEELARRQIPELSFGVIIFPDADEAAFATIENQYTRIKQLVGSASNGQTKARYGIFHAIPIAKLDSLPKKHNAPELFNFYTPLYDGKNFTVRELFERRMELTRKLDPSNFQAMAVGNYRYG